MIRNDTSVSILSLVVLVLVPLPSRAQQHRHASPYAELQDREIKALSQGEIEGLLRGEGMGMALPAELHGYPGPRHVLDLADELGLSEAQRSRVREIFETMHEGAASLGREIVELERELDAAFAERTVTREELERLVARIGGRRADLRTVHLGAHLELRSVLTEAQRARYGELRGYGHRR